MSRTIEDQIIINCNGQSLSPALLELTISKINEHEQVMLTNVGKSSAMEIGAALIGMVKKAENEGTVPYPDVPTEDHPYTGDTPLPTRTRNIDE